MTASLVDLYDLLDHVAFIFLLSHILPHFSPKMLTSSAFEGEGSTSPPRGPGSHGALPKADVWFSVLALVCGVFCQQ